MRFAPLIILLLPAAALADAPPSLRPLHDVDVTYKVPVPGGGEESLLQRYRWSAATQRQRVDLPTSGKWMVLDFISHRMALVQDGSHEVLDVPSPQSADQPGGGAGFTRVGTGNVAGFACTQWHTVDTRGQQTDACYTEDGVLLRVTAGARTLLEAVSVKYAAQDDAVFQVPSGYTHQQTSR
jgi:hypothetical protein